MACAVGAADRGELTPRPSTPIAGWLERELQPRGVGVGVVLEAEHLCMSLRGVQKQGATTVTSALHAWCATTRTRQEFLALTGRSQVAI